MFHSSKVSVAIAAAYASVAVAQQSGWIAGQVNATMCLWQQLRASVIRDTVYLDGGFLYWTPGMADGTYDPVVQDTNPQGLIYMLNFSTPFNISNAQTPTNFSSILNPLSRVSGGAANNLAPNYFDGAMLGNDNEWFLYGGLVAQTDAYSPPRSDDVIAYAAYQYGAQKPAFGAGFFTAQLPDPMTRYVAYGGAANAPSENKAWYFSGMKSPTDGPIFYPSGSNESILAVNVSNTLITLDMSTQSSEKWTNTTLPGNIKGRAGPELVWVPASSQGILVALGGVTYPEFDNAAHKSKNETASEAESPVFMSTIDVYDIATDTWYSQPTLNGPGALARGCAVVAVAQDASSFNIYYYGGYDGLHRTDAASFSDDVWILSLPSFMWMKVSSGRPGYARAGHKCVKPYPDQMMVIGGYPAQPGEATTCLTGGMVQMFNLTAVDWMDHYDPSEFSEYRVPEMIYQMIGGSPTGGATSTTPGPTGWATPALSEVFQTAYPTTKLTSYYPYVSAAANSSRPNYSSGGGGGLPTFVPPLLGTILGLVLVASLIVGFLLYRRRKYLRKNPGTSEDGTDENGHRILSWMRGQPNPSDHKALTVTTSEDIPLSPDMEQARTHSPMAVHEMSDTQVVELMDTSPRAELHDTGLTPIDIINKHSHFAQDGNRSPSPLGQPSYYSSIAATDHASMISSNSGAQHPLRPPPTGIYRPDSPSLPADYARDGGAASSNLPATARESEISALGDRDHSHLRKNSDPATVSTMDHSMVASPPMMEEGAFNPLRSNPHSVPQTPTKPSTPPFVSPPTVGEVDGDDYMSVAKRPEAAVVSPTTGSPQRRSVFHENREDLGGPGHA